MNRDTPENAPDDDQTTQEPTRRRIRPGAPGVGGGTEPLDQGEHEDGVTSAKILGDRVQATLVADAAPPGSLDEYGKLRAGTVLNHTYRIERMIGSGGVGDVYLGRHLELDTLHAIKILNPAMVEHPYVGDLFRREAAVLRHVRHDAVVTFDGYIRDEAGRSYLVMEYVEGESLLTFVRDHGRLSVAQVHTLCERLSGGLAELHRKGAVHRDISPDNVLLPDGRVEDAKLIDLGVCKLTDPATKTILGNSFAGKFHYASPEQVGLFDGKVDERSDVYSLGLVLAAAAIGSPLPMGDTFDAVIKARQKVPDLSEAPEELRPLLDAMLQPDPAQRMRITEHPATFTRSLGPDATAQTGPLQTGGQAPGRIKPALIAAAALGVLALAMGGFYLYRPGPDDPLVTDASPTAGSVEATHPSGDRTPATTAPSARVAKSELQDLLDRGRTAEAFAAMQTIVRAGGSAPEAELFRLSGRLREEGLLDQAFAAYRHLANQGQGESALIIGEMYDPLYWSRTVSPFSGYNARKAEQWYRRAADGGVDAAAQRLVDLEAWRPRQSADPQ